MPASTITVAQWVRRTIQWWRRTNGRAFCSLVTIGSVTLPRYGRTGRRVRGDRGILTNVQRLPRPPRPALACRPDDSTPTRRSRPPRTDRRARRRCRQLVVELESQRAGVVPLTRPGAVAPRSEEHTSELQSQFHLVCRLLLEKKKRMTPQHRVAIPRA